MAEESSLFLMSKNVTGWEVRRSLPKLNRRLGVVGKDIERKADVGTCLGVRMNG